MTIIPYILNNTDSRNNNLRSVNGLYAITDRSELEEFQSDPVTEVINVPYLISFKGISKVYPENIAGTMSDFIHDELADYFRNLPNFNDWKNKYLKNLCSQEYTVRRTSGEVEQLENISIENAYVFYQFSGANVDGGCNVSLRLRNLFFYSPDITPAPEESAGSLNNTDSNAMITKAKTYYYYSESRFADPRLAYIKPIYQEEIQEELNDRSYFGGFYHEDFGGYRNVEYKDNGGYVIIQDSGYSSSALITSLIYNSSDYHNLIFGINDVPQTGPFTPICVPAIFPLFKEQLTIKSDHSYGIIKLSDLTYHNIIEETGENVFWGWDDIVNNFWGTEVARTIRKGPLFEFDSSKWKCVPNLGAYAYPLASTKYTNDIEHIKDGDKLYFDIELGDKTINYKGEGYEFIDGIAKNVAYDMLPLKTGEHLKTIYIPLWAYSPNKSISFTLRKLPKHWSSWDVGDRGKKTETLYWKNTISVPKSIYLLFEIEYEERLQYGQVNFSINFTGMGNDPCKECCCDCEIEPKKYKTVVAFTSREVLKDRAEIAPDDLEYEWQDNTLILMLEKGQEVTVDNLPVGTKYEISLDMDSEEYDECDKNEYSIENSSGTVGENSEGEEEEETEIVVNAQAGETIQQYLDRLRQRGYEELAKSLKLENVEFTLQDERIKLGDLVTVDLPEFDFKAVVRVTGVKLKSQGNQVIRTISVGTPLKILRRSKI